MWCPRWCFGVIVFLAVVVKQGFCTVRCFSCSSKQSRDCIRPDESQISLMKCDIEALEKTRQYAADINRSYDKIFEVDMIEAGRMELSCLKVVTKVGNKDFVLRGCQLAEQRHLDICRKLEEKSDQLLQVTHCSKCMHDHCNSSSRITINMATFLLTVIIYKLFYTT